MGYRSDVVLAVRKDVYLKCQLLQNIPKCLHENSHDVSLQAHGNAMYWEIQGWKWYDSYPEIQEINAWIEWLEDEEENPPEQVELRRDKDNKPIYTDMASFGGIRIGEDSTDVEEWGCPSEFDLYVCTSISRPY